MPILKSAKKALRQNEQRRAHSLQYQRTYKRLMKEVRSLLGKEKLEEAKKLLPQLYKALGKSAKENVVKKNTARRYKSRVTKAINKAKKPAPKKKGK